MRTFNENVKESVAVAPQSITATVANGATVDMAKFNNFVATILVAAATQYNGAVTCVIAESTDDSTWSDTYLATVTIASSTDTDAVDTVEVKASELSAGYRYARVECTPATGTVNTLAAVNQQFNPRYKAV